MASEAFERWDGMGGPYGRGGDDLALVTRIVEVAYVAELFRGRQGRAAALETLQLRAGSQLDPSVVAAFVDSAADLFALVEIGGVSPWATLLDAEPQPVQRVSDAQLEDVARALARFADLKSAWFNGHSESVARLAEAAAVAIGCDARTVAVVRVAGLLHDVGRVGIATGLWEAPRTLSPPEMSRVQLHTWETQRILASVQLFDDVARTASCAHERLDGSGYHRNARANDTDVLARLLAAADVACALAEDRPYRPAATRAEAAALLSAEATAGRLDHAAVRAVLAAGGGPQPLSVRWPAGLSDREVDVLRLIAAGASSRRAHWLQRSVSGARTSPKPCG